MALYTLRPISDRTPFGHGCRTSPFTVTWSTALDLLGSELRALNATNTVLEADFAERDLRVDGTLRANAKLASGAVRLAFDSDQGPLVYATDTFQRPSWRRHGMQYDWQHNVYAIARALEALRLVDRYGVVRRGEQYAGFKALPAPAAAVPMGHDEALNILCATAGIIRVDPLTPTSELMTAWRKARVNAHPDRRNGDRTLWDQVEQAATVLGLNQKAQP